MADYTVRVVGENSGGSNSVPPQTPSNSPQTNEQIGSRPQARDYIPDTNRLTEEYRKLLQQHGGVVIPGSANARQLWGQVEANARQEVTDSVQEKYNRRRLEVAEGRKQKEDELYAQQDSRREDLDLWRDRQRDIILDNWRKKGKNPEDPRNPIEKSAEWRAIDKEYDETSKLYDAQNKREWRLFEAQSKAEDKQVDKEEKDELAAALRELTTILKDSKEAVERDDERGDNPDSYLGRLRAERRQILEERENALTKEAAEAAGKRLADVDERIKRASSPSDTDYLRSTQLVSGGLQQTLRGLQEADPGSVINGVGSSIVGITGATGAAAMKALGWIGLAGAVVNGGWDMMKASAGRYDAMGSLAAYRPGNTENGQYGVLEATLKQVENNSFYGMGISKFGMSYEDFAARAAQTIRARGTSEDWWNETYRQIGLEKNFGLDKGQLVEGARFDRYGESVTRGISDLVTILNDMKVQGATSDDFSRVREKYDFQQTVMQSYLSRTDKPSYEVANRVVAGMNAIQGITHDERDVSDYQVMQNAILNPKNERMRAMIYRSVSRIMPELVDTDGNQFSRSDGTQIDLIKRALQNPENEQKIISAVFGDLKSMYGGTDNQLGFHAWEEILPGINVERRDKMIEQLTNGGDAAQIFTGTRDRGMQQIIAEHGRNNMEAYTQQAAQLTSVLTQKTDEWKLFFQGLVDQITGAINRGEK